MALKRGRPTGSSEGAKEAVQEILAARRLLYLSENKLAAEVGLNQSTVNRLLRAKKPVWTPGLRKLWNYAQNIIRTHAPEAAPAESGEQMLLAALLNLWDGTAIGAERLLRLLRCVDELRTASTGPLSRRKRDHAPQTSRRGRAD
jgi:transcriptional regulator with XRE-family HTH domain